MKKIFLSVLVLFVSVFGLGTAFASNLSVNKLNSAYIMKPVNFLFDREGYRIRIMTNSFDQDVGWENLNGPFQDNALLRSQRNYKDNLLYPKGIGRGTLNTLIFNAVNREGRVIGSCTVQINKSNQNSGISCTGNIRGRVADDNKSGTLLITTYKY